MTEFYKNYLRLCAKKNETPSAVAKKAGFSNATATGWARGATPSDMSLVKLCNYFGCDMTDLLGQRIFDEAMQELLANPKTVEELLEVQCECLKRTILEKGPTPEQLEILVRYNNCTSLYKEPSPAKQIMILMEQLNMEGQELLVETADTMVHSGKYSKKGSQPGLGSKEA